MICLGIESTAHTFGVGIVNEKKVLANVKESYTTESGGMNPIEVSRAHEKIYKKVIDLALSEANLLLSDIDIVSYSRGPGFGTCLKVAMKAVEEIGKPFVGVNHCVSHLEVGKFATKAKDPVLLYASGANTQVIAYEGKKYRVFGETLDMGVGNFIDSFARYMGLGFPGGPKISILSEESDKEFIKLPYVVKGMDVSFSGLLTNLKQKYDSRNYKKGNLAYSMQETTFAMLLEVAERAMAHCDKKELLLGGGVACNKRLQEMAKKMCEERGAKCFIPPNELMLDNGAMIAVSGLYHYKKGRKEKLEIRPYERTDDVKVD
ncbi:tRNA (adenosine(37)-N6)-threonylcarbamoyltransferase complex transferase subunit TsaD [archaeon]|jgi:N6-L-threonylcarbamoyladenine synthase|nr:tRNA (adenosine(37)-N6)-threonylcarbamoyltransferase complex transferase subunit TsaD [archaeon]MBT6824278.1 tRNA (adenosine(37)-N6)-threonylcarbamoyltransferase complex transferase subunit TsaD [archaeon]MBT7107356.1 tRNA (adenosine(37)-N6)-threonylcarbamoyltransferase complex transferase subunit TsaD [archaeon]MBT7297322.1 tRNA (adenosine(37)-N6)-threonylcarbamoyltransferase complex transferase subunit TsaD [archaeon]